MLFDLDGVLTPTAELHQRAWAALFQGYLDDHVPTAEPYTAADYLAFVDGKPRFDGVRSFLASRDLHLPDGEIDDPPGDGTVAALGNRKNELFNRMLHDDGIAPYPGSLALLDALDGVAVAVVSSSRNARAVLAAAGLTDRFRVVVDGQAAAEGHMAGKPAPDMFFAAADALGVRPAGAVVVEDAIAGVRSGAAGDFALVIGVDRGAGRSALLDAGAHLVVADLGELVPGGGG